MDPRENAAYMQAARDADNPTDVQQSSVQDAGLSALRKKVQEQVTKCYSTMLEKLIMTCDGQDGKYSGASDSMKERKNTGIQISRNYVG